MHWHDYLHDKDPHHHSVVGDLRVARQVYSPQLDNTRDLLVCLPPSYHHDTARRYPVVYMHDGQNLFDHATSYAGEWHADSALQTLAGEGIEAILVGIPNTGEDRIREYNPFDHPRFGAGRGEDYIRFILHTVKPLIDHDFRTDPHPSRTGIMGSSMGGLISLYAFFQFAGAFGFAGVMSPSLWLRYDALVNLIRTAPRPGGRLYLDVGAKEISHRTSSIRNRHYIDGVRGIRDELEARGYREGDNFLYVEDADGKHSEDDWARRLPDALRFLLRG